MPGVHLVIGGHELASATDALLIGVDAPLVTRYPLAVDRARYAGEWVAAVVAESRALAEDAREKVRSSTSRCRSCSTARPPIGRKARRYIPRMGPTCCSTSASYGATSTRPLPRRRTRCPTASSWGRSATVPIETFGVVASWDPWREMLDVWASIQMPKFADQIARALRMPPMGVCVHQDVDVGGSYGVKRGIKHTVLAGYLSRRLSRPVKLIEDRLENMRGGDMHGPERVFDIELAYGRQGLVHAMRIARSTTSARTRVGRRCSSASRSAPSSARTASARSPITPSP